MGSSKESFSAGLGETVFVGEIWVLCLIFDPFSGLIVYVAISVFLEDMFIWWTFVRNKSITFEISLFRRTM